MQEEINSIVSMARQIETNARTSEAAHWRACISLVLANAVTPEDFRRMLTTMVAIGDDSE